MQLCVEYGWLYRMCIDMYVDRLCVCRGWVRAGESVSESEAICSQDCVEGLAWVDSKTRHEARRPASRKADSRHFA